MKLFKSATYKQYEGWRLVTLADFQLSDAFLNDQGKFKYGVFRLSSETIEKVENEIVKAESGSFLNIAIIDASVSKGSPVKTSAFRHDLDFYLFTAMSEAHSADLEAYINSITPAPCLCLVTGHSETPTHL